MQSILEEFGEAVDVTLMVLRHVSLVDVWVLTILHGAERVNVEDLGVDAFVYDARRLVD